MEMKCPYCGSEIIVKAGIRKNKRTVKQRYLCKKCKRRFIERDGFERMGYPKEIIVLAIHLYIEGLSLSKVREIIHQHFGYYLYDSVILYWVKKYAKMLEEFEAKLVPKVKGRLHTDEVVVKVKKERKYSVNTVDSVTKYNVETSFMCERNERECKAHFKKLWVRIGGQVKERWAREKVKPPGKRKLITFVSDRFENYRNGFNSYFYRWAKLVFGVPIACRKYGLAHNNNPIERHNQDFKQRYKTMRTFKSLETARSFNTLRRIVYNFVRTHQGLGKTPAEAAELNLNLGRNRLLGLIIFFLFTQR